MEKLHDFGALQYVLMNVHIYDHIMISIWEGVCMKV